MIEALLLAIQTASAAMALIDEIDRRSSKFLTDDQRRKRQEMGESLNQSWQAYLRARREQDPNFVDPPHPLARTE